MEGLAPPMSYYCNNKDTSMIFAVNNTPAGYVVAVHFLDKDGVGRWHDMRNFGEHQGDAKIFAYVDCPKYDEGRIMGFVNTYRPDVQYHRAGEGRLIRDR